MQVVLEKCWFIRIDRKNERMILVSENAVCGVLFSLQGGGGIR